jgi:hypothetical protein
MVPNLHRAEELHFRRETLPNSEPACFKFESFEIRTAAFWVALAAVPAGLLVAVTAHISTDVAAAPLLWVLPLALYLLTFVIAFSRGPIIPHRLVVALQPPFVVALVAVIIFIFNLINNILWLLALHLAVFFVNALMCHGELAPPYPKINEQCGHF